MGLVGEKPESVVSLLVTGILLTGSQHNPKGSGRSKELVNKSTGWGAPLDGAEDAQQVEKEYQVGR